MVFSRVFLAAFFTGFFTGFVARPGCLVLRRRGQLNFHRIRRSYAPTHARKTT